MTRCLVIAMMLALGPGSLSGQDAPTEKPKDEPVEALRPTAIYFHYAVYYAPKPEGDPVATARKVLAADFAKDFTYRDEDTKLVKGNYLAYRSLPLQDYAPPSATYLQHKGFGITPQQREQLQEAENVLLVDVFAIKPENFDYLTAVNQLVLAVAEQTQGFIWDEETREMFSPLAWSKTRIPEPDGSIALANTTMHGYEIPSKNFRAVSFGMRKLGLPDIAITEFPKPFWTPTMSMMRFVVAYIGDLGPLAPKQRWTGQELKTLLGLESQAMVVPEIQLVPAKREQGDPSNDLWTINFGLYPGETYHEKQAHVIFKLFQRDDPMLGVWDQREELMKLSEAARAKLAAKKEGLVKEGLKAKERLVLKAFVENEYLWVDFKRWQEDILEGELLNDATADGAKKQGDPLKVPFDQVFDYLFVHADGTEEGNETTKFIGQVQEKMSKAAGASNPAKDAPVTKE